MHREMQTEEEDDRSGSKMLALQAALANVIAQRHVLRTSTRVLEAGSGIPRPAETDEDAERSPASTTAEHQADERESHRPAMHDSSGTPEAIRSSRRLRQNHEKMLARFDAKEHAEGDVAERLQSLQQRRRELARALEHLEVVQAVPVQQADDSTTEKPAWPLRDVQSGYSRADDTRLALEALDASARNDGRSGSIARPAKPEQDRADESSSCLSSSLCGHDDASGAGDILGETGSFDVLVQNLLRVSLSDGADLVRESVTWKAGEPSEGDKVSYLEIGPVPCQNAQMPTCELLFPKNEYAASERGSSSALEGKQPSTYKPFSRLEGAYVMGDDLHGSQARETGTNPENGTQPETSPIPTSAHLPTASCTRSRGQPESAENSLRDLLGKGHCISGLLRPEDLQTLTARRANRMECEKEVFQDFATSQFQHARLCAAAALERAYLGRSAGGETPGNLIRSELVPGHEQLLPPLALSLAASLRRSSTGIVGMEMPSKNEEAVGKSNAADGIQQHQESW